MMWVSLHTKTHPIHAGSILMARVYFHAYQYRSLFPALFLQFLFHQCLTLFVTMIYMYINENVLQYHCWGNLHNTSSAEMVSFSLSSQAECQQMYTTWQNQKWFLMGIVRLYHRKKRDLPAITGCSCFVNLSLFPGDVLLFNTGLTVPIALYAYMSF